MLTGSWLKPPFIAAMFTTATFLNVTDFARSLFIPATFGLSCRYGAHFRLPRSRQFVHALLPARGAPSGNGEFQVSVRGCGADDSELKPYLSMIKQTMEVRLMQSMRAEA